MPKCICEGASLSGRNNPPFKGTIDAESINDDLKAAMLINRSEKDRERTEKSEHEIFVGYRYARRLCGYKKK